jgi:glutamate formiminotransferase
MLFVEFSVEEDGDDFYRVMELSIDEIQIYSTELIDDEFMENIDEDSVIEIVENYLFQNGLPDQIIL